jgi:serine/threonine-protein kinase RsbW
VNETTTVRTYCLTKAAHIETLPAFREMIRVACGGDANIGEQTCYDLQLAVDEACSNIIEHGYAGMNPGSIMLELQLTPDRATITITDFGHPFEPVDAPMPETEAAMQDPEISGFGLFFIYNFMDEVDYQSSEAGNHLILIKNLASKGIIRD